MTSSPTVLLLGGTGRTGQRVLEQLLARGVRVRAIVRSTDKIPQALRVRPARADTRRTRLERAVTALLRWVLPPANDNQAAADLLVRQIGVDDRQIAWVVVRPDTLVPGDAGSYELHEALIDPVFSPGETTIANVGHFISQLATDPATFAKWRGKFPVVVNPRLPAQAPTRAT